MKSKIWGLSALVALVISASSTGAQTASSDKVQAAYDIAKKCFIADGWSAGNRKKAHDSKREAYFDKKADDASATGRKLAATLGYPGRRFIDDVWEMKDDEFAHYYRDPDYYSQVAATCKAYGLM